MRRLARTATNPTSVVPDTVSEAVAVTTAVTNSVLLVSTAVAVPLTVVVVYGMPGRLPAPVVKVTTVPSTTGWP